MITDFLMLYGLAMLYVGVACFASVVLMAAAMKVAQFIGARRAR